MARTTIEDLRCAVEWLTSNEGAEFESCRRVAAHLEKEIERRELNNLILRKSREHGMPVSTIRRALRQAKQTAALRELLE